MSPLNNMPPAMRAGLQSMHGVGAPEGKKRTESSSSPTFSSAARMPSENLQTKVLSFGAHSKELGEMPRVRGQGFVRGAHPEGKINPWQR